MNKVKAKVFGHLLKRHQWNLFLVACQSWDDHHLGRHHWHTRFADGKYLPLGIFFDVHWRPDLPYLSWAGPVAEKKSDAIHMQTPNGQKFAVLKLRDRSALCRQYWQFHTDNGLPYIQLDRVRRVSHSKMLYFPIAGVPGRKNKPGMRCIQIVPIPRKVKDPVIKDMVELTLKTGTLEGYFDGVVDIWAEENDVYKGQHLHKLTLFSQGE